MKAPLVPPADLYAVDMPLPPTETAAASDEVDVSADEDEIGEGQEEELVKRKKPTRRAGRRARHRRCHAAEARRLAEEAGTAAAGELPEGSVQDENLTTSVSSGGMGTRNRIEPKLTSDSQRHPCESSAAAPSAASTADASTNPEPVRRGGRPPKKSVLAAQAAAEAKAGATADTQGLGLNIADMVTNAIHSRLGNGSELAAGAMTVPPFMVDPYAGSISGDAVASSALAVPEGDPEDVLGKRVLVVGLVKQPAFNGEWGRVELYDASLQRFVVSVQRDSGPPLLAKLRRENLLVPPTLALRFDDEFKADSTSQLPTMMIASPPPYTPQDPVALSAAMTGSTAGTEALVSPAMAAAQSGKGEPAEKWKPTLRPVVGDRPN